MFFNFLQDMGNYQDRKVDRFESDDLIVSTARVSDGLQPYETAIAHRYYNDGNLIAVQGYDSKQEAQDGHDKWVKIMTDENLPDSLTECANAEMAAQFLGKRTYEKVVK